MNIIRAIDHEDMACKAANLIAAQVLIKPKSILGLATGSTPLGVYARLILKQRAAEVSFAAVKSVNLDEYCGIAASDETSYRYYMNHNLFDQIDIDPANTYLPDGMAADFDAECARYDHVIEELGGVDLQLLGIGMNGHIGFNEPCDHFKMGTHCVQLTQSTREANAIYFSRGMEDMPSFALTMGMRPIMQAKRVLLVAGANKKEVIAQALEGPVTPRVPASILQLHPRLTVVYCEQ